MIRTISYSIILALLPLLTAFASPNVVVTNHALELILKEIATDLKITTILDTAGDPHTFEIKPSQIMQIQNADLFFGNGGSLEPWIRKVVSKKTLLLKDFAEQEIEGAFWLDPTVVRKTAQALTDDLCQLEKEKCKQYQIRLLNFSDRLNKTDLLIREKAKIGNEKSLLVFHDLYQPLSKTYAIKFFGGLKSCEVDTDTAVKIANIIKQTKESKITKIFVEDRHDLENLGALEELKLKAVMIDPYGVSSESYIEMTEKVIKVLFSE